MTDRRPRCLGNKQCYIITKLFVALLYISIKSIQVVNHEFIHIVHNEIKTSARLNASNNVDYHIGLVEFWIHLT